MDPKEPKEPIEPKEPKEPKEPTEPKEPKEPEEPMDLDARIKNLEEQNRQIMEQNAKLIKMLEPATGDQNQQIDSFFDSIDKFHSRKKEDK